MKVPPGTPTLGTTDPLLSKEPLMTEGEATAGPDDMVPYDEPEREDFVPETVDPVTPELPPLEGPSLGFDLPKRGGEPPPWL